MSTFWSLWIIAITVINLVLVTWVLFSNRRIAVDDTQPDDEPNTMGHTFDGIQEYDNPLPKWWFQMFVGTIVFAVIYLIFYPGLGNFKGVLGWSSQNQLEREEQRAVEESGDYYQKIAGMSYEELINDSRAMRMGLRVYANNCAVCHGADGGGNVGFPNLTDKAWLYGGDFKDIYKSIAKGRKGNMPPMGSALGEPATAAVAEYVLSMSGLDHDAAKAAEGEKSYGIYCAGCHGKKGEGNKFIGAPNLADNDWLFEPTRESIVHIVNNGIKNNLMPAQEDKLRAEKIHLLTAYVYSLSHTE